MRGTLHKLLVRLPGVRDDLGTMNARVVLTAVYEPVENGWVPARIAEIPGVITAGATVDEARELLLDAFREYLLSFSS